MTVKTLDELREENAKLENEESEQPASEDLEVESEAVEDEPQETDEVAEPESEESEESEIESWRLTDEQQSEEDEKTFTSHDIKKAKEKLKVRLAAKDDENESLKAEIERLNKQLESPQVSQQVKPKPTLESVDYDEDKFADEMADWVASQVDNRLDAKEKSRQLEAQKIEQKKAIDAAVDSHLERAAKLDGIKPENYQAAELNVRRTIDNVIPKSGDAVADSLIATLGDGSEKIFYQLGVNSKLREQFQAKLLADKTGSSALVFLGELKGKLSSTVKHRSSAPKPAKVADGGSSPAQTESALERKYKKAKTSQERFNIAREAKQAGLNPNNW
ncbi:MAG: hypothetical protein K0U08_03340 [Proteobacteria bacterium]|nr:hypothetical protein [Pseudomonadota bacterium]